VQLEHFESRDNEVTEVLSLALTVVNLVSLVKVLSLEEVHDGEDLTVVGHKGFSDSVTAHDELLQDLEGSGDHIMVARVKRGLDRDDELRDDGKDLSVSVVEEVEDTLDGKESVGILLLTDTLHEDGEVMMVVELADLDFP